MNKKSKAKSSVPAGLLKMSDAQIQARQGMKRSGAAGSHDSRPNRARTRGAAKGRAIRESRDSW